MKISYLPLLPILLLAGCSSPSERSASLPEARRGFQTTVQPQKGSKDPIEPAPAKVFQTVKYPSAAGQLGAYLTPNPGDGKKHPAIIWITGGDCNSIGGVWSPGPRSNEQTASAYRQAGIVMMFPSLRGGNDNPGTKEGFFGEVDDVLAAAKYLEQQPYVDPKRIYLGGHSTGGTLVLLVAESSDRFRAVFSFGPVEDVSGYGTDSGFLPFDVSNKKEVESRSPGYWLHSVQSPVWVIEGVEQSSNIDPLRVMKAASTNPKAHFVEVSKVDHFSVLGPVNELLAQKILQDSGETTNLSLTEDEANRSAAK